MNSYFKFQFFQILLLLTSTLALSQDSRVFDNLKMESKILGQERSYAVYLPSDYDTSNRSYPVLYLLHGLGDDQTGWIKLGDVQRITDESINSGISSPMIIVMPDAGSGIVGYINQPNRDWLYEDFFFEELLPHVESKYRINLWLLAANERIFYKFNPFYEFSTEEVLSIN